MIFQDNVIKEYLKNVYFVTGTPCGGKTTISRELAKRHNLLVFDIDEEFDKHQKLSNPAYQPSMNRKFKDADEFFGRTVEEYKQWLISNTREQLDFVLMDLICLSQNRKVVCDCHLTMEQAKMITEPSRVAFLIKEPTNLVEEYCNRPDHQGFSNFIHSASDVEKAKGVCSATLQSLNEKNYKNIKNSDYFWLERTPERTVEDMVTRVENHFGLGKKEFSDAELVLKKVDKNTELVEQLISFVEQFSWDDVKEHLLHTLRTWEYTDWETPFVAMADNKIIGMASIMKNDYYPIPEIYPWISSIFVEEKYRGYRISEKLINFANKYAMGCGFNKTYISSEHMGLYEKYGYCYLQDIVNYGNGIDRLYVKQLG